MNLRRAVGRLDGLLFRLVRMLAGLVPGGRVEAFGHGAGRIGRIVVINLDRQPIRMRRTLRELARFRNAEGARLTSMARRLSAVDARDGRAVAADGDVDPEYLLGHQLHVQPDERLEASFACDAPVRMTRQEVAVARSHVEAWKSVRDGSDDHVLVLEDDVWFVRRAASRIDRAWRAALRRDPTGSGPRMLYLSYADAGGTAERADDCGVLFRPLRGLWFLSGYVLSREGARVLLAAMPVVGPVDMWMNFRFGDLGALAVSSPVAPQRRDGGSDNSYSVLPFLARAGIVDSDSLPPPARTGVGPVLAWSADPDDGLAMALSMLGLRVRRFDREIEQALSPDGLRTVLGTFDALVDPPLDDAASEAVLASNEVRFVLQSGTAAVAAARDLDPPAERTAFVRPADGDARWDDVCRLLGLPRPAEAFPHGTPRSWGLFTDGRCLEAREKAPDGSASGDHSAWALGSLPEARAPRPPRRSQPTSRPTLQVDLMEASPRFEALEETFPGNAARFRRERVRHGPGGASIVLDRSPGEERPFASGALASIDRFLHGRFEVEMRAASGSGLVTGFFLHRSAPRQEIDVEIMGDDPTRMLVNVFFNPGDEGADLSYGYRGSPFRVDLGFDASAAPHRYAIDWSPDRIAWSVDGTIVHERPSWSPTPIPHLPMRLHCNLWAPRSTELAGAIDPRVLPGTARFRNIGVWQAASVRV